jgi:excisionase family DNA binding protein
MDNTAELIRASILAISDKPPRLAYSIDEAAESIGVSKRTIEELLSTGQLRSKVIGRRRLIPVSALRKLIGEP